jgi:uncharacterized protein
MIYTALTGITRRVMKELLSSRIRTLELRSPNNFVAMLNIQPGERIFLTETSAPDVTTGTSGLIARVNGAQIITHRTVQSTDDYYEERESQAARVQLQLVGIGRVRSASSSEAGLPMRLEVDEVKYCDAR